MSPLRGVNILLIVLGVIFVLVGLITLRTDVLVGLVGGIGGVLMVVGGSIALAKSRGTTT